MPKVIIREYNMEDEAMNVRAQVIHDNLVTDLALFTAKFPFITAATTTAIQASIDSAEALPLDTQVISNLKVLTADVNAQVALGRNALSTLGIYAKLTYPNDEARQRVFGQDTWAAASADQEKMMNALEHAHSQCTTAPYAAALAAKGFLAADATQLLNIANEIRTRNQLQENAKANRPVTTQDRIVQYNSVWAQIQDISLASKVVFADNPAKYEQYLLYPQSSENTTVNITVLIAETIEPMVNATVLLTNTSLSAKTTDGEGKASFSSVDMPELLNIKITSEGNAVSTFDNQNITPGTSNNISLEAVV